VSLDSEQIRLIKSAISKQIEHSGVQIVDVENPYFAALCQLEQVQSKYIFRNKIEDNKILEEVKEYIAIEFTKTLQKENILHDFNYKAESLSKTLNNMSKASSIVHGEKIESVELNIERTLAIEFLPDLEKRREQLISDRQVYIDFLSDESVDYPEEAQDVFNGFVEDFTNSLESLNNSIAAIGSDDEYVQFDFPIPPNVTFGSLSDRQIKSIQKSDSSKMPEYEASVTNWLQETIEFYQEKSYSKLEVATIIAEMNPESIKLTDVQNLIDSKQPEFAVMLAGQVTNKLYTKLAKIPLKLPLSKENEIDLRKISELHAIMQPVRTDNANFDRVSRSIESKIDVAKINDLLASHEKNLYANLLKTGGKTSKISKNLNEAQAEFLRIKFIASEGGYLNAVQKRFASDMIEKSIGDMSFNKRLTEFSREDKNVSKKKYAIDINHIKYFSYKTKDAKKLNDILKRSQINLDLIESGLNVNPADRISVSEYGVLLDIAKTKFDFDLYAENGLIAIGSELANMYEQVYKSTEILEKINQLAEKQDLYRDGDIIMVRAKNQRVLKHKSANIEDFLQDNLFTKYSHSSQLVRDLVDGKLKQSHIYASYEHAEIKVRDLVPTDIIRIDPTKLVSPENAKSLEKLYSEQGKDWKKEITREYQEIQQEMHSNAGILFRNTANDVDRRFEAGMAKFGFYGGYNSSDELDRKKVRDEMMGLNDVTAREKMFCSEFVARGVVATFVTLNERLVKKMKEQGIEVSDEIIKNPIPKEHSLKTTHPQKLIDLLNDSGCIEVVESSLINSLIQKDNLMLNETRKIDISKGIISCFQQLSKESNTQEEFIKKGQKIFSAYIKAEKLVGPEISEAEMLKEVKKPLEDLYQSFSKQKPASFVGAIKDMIKKFAETIGIKSPRVEKIVNKTVEKFTMQQKKDKINKFTTKIKNERRAPPKAPHVGRSI
jgi:hypothetical protein